jgi:DNA-binding MarR family transcriptional regulator
VTQVNGIHDDVPGHLAFLLHMATRRLRAEAENAAAAAPSLQAAQARLLDVIPRAGGRLTDIALAMRISKQGLGQLATSLVHEGLVDIMPDPLDKRAKIIRRTGPGDDVMRTIRTAIDDVEKRCRAEVGNEHYETFLDVLRVVSGVGPHSLFDHGS